MTTNLFSKTTNMLILLAIVVTAALPNKLFGLCGLFTSEKQIKVPATCTIHMTPHTTIYMLSNFVVVCVCVYLVHLPKNKLENYSHNSKSWNNSNSMKLLAPSLRSFRLLTLYAQLGERERMRMRERRGQLIMEL